MERIEIAGTQLEVARLGQERSGPTVVLLHEGLGSVSAWRSFPETLSERLGLPVFVYSRAGYGGSDPVSLPRPLDYMQREGLEVLPALLDAAGIDDAILVGHSDGASIALVYASTPHGHERVRGLVLMAPHVFCEDRSVAAIERTRDAYEQTELRTKLARHHAHVDVAFWGWNRAWLDPGFREWTLEPFLPEVRAPALLIQSEDDPYGTLRQLDAIQAGVAGPTERLELSDCGHAPHRERPTATLEAIASFAEALR